MTGVYQPKLRVLFVLPSLAAGGAERVLINLMNGLDRARFEPVLLTLQEGGALRSSVESDIPVRHLKGLPVQFSMAGLYRIFKAIRPDIVISTMAHMNFAVLILRPFFPRTKFIVREAITPSFFLHSHPRLAPLIRLCYRLLYPLAHRVVSPAQLILREFEKDLGMALKLPVWLPNPVDEDRLRGFGVAPGVWKGARFVAAGRLHHQKGFDRLITALKGFDPGHEWHLTILGSGGEQAKLQALIDENDLGAHITLSGHAECPWPYFAAADAFILPSRWEGLPNVVLESLACGTPVIAMKEAGGIAEIAELAPSSVSVVDDMPSLIEAMRIVRPLQTTQLRPSLLPDIFRHEAVNRRFAEILSSCLPSPLPPGEE